MNKDHMGDLGIDGTIILTLRCGNVDQFLLAQDRINLWDLVTVIMNLQVP
jgi:hypothetical protein